MTGQDLPLKWADSAQFHAQEQHDWDEKVGVPPKATLIWMTPDPLGALASFNQMYEGNVIRSMADVDDDMRCKALTDVMATHLQAPLENIKVQFLLEGGDRAFQQQLTRQRTAVYAIESLRFAVKGNLRHATTLPPHLHGSEESKNVELARKFSLEEVVKSWEYTHAAEEDQNRVLWDYAIQMIDEVYHHLVDAGMPAEEARGLLPLATAGPIQFTTDFRNLIAHSGNRLCTQAQFHWRSFFNQMVEQIRDQSLNVPKDQAWQYEAIADSNMFKPVCYQLGHCPFKASFDRACSIRDRVDAFSEQGVSSVEWGQPREAIGIGSGYRKAIRPIATSEWKSDPAAARTVI